MAKIVPQNGSGLFVWVDVPVLTIYCDVIFKRVSKVTFFPKVNGHFWTFWPFFFLKKKATTFGGCHYHFLKEHTFYISKPVSEVQLQFFVV
jgi:hypothetical protein